MGGGGGGGGGGGIIHRLLTIKVPKKTIKLEGILRDGNAWDFWNTSWHCSSCFSTVSEMSLKIEAFSHQKYDQPEFSEQSEIVRRVRNGLDFFNREGEDYGKIESNEDIPKYLKLNRKRFNYMLD